MPQHKKRDDAALLHGVLIAIGALGILDTIIVHWLLGWHRLVQAWSSSANLVAEAAVVLGSAGLVIAGLVREKRRRALRTSSSSARAGAADSPSQGAS